MKKISFIVSILSLVALPLSTHAMTLGDVMKQYNLYRQDALTYPVVLGASASANGSNCSSGTPCSTTTPAPTPMLPAGADAVLLKGLQYSSGSSSIITGNLKKGAVGNEVTKLQLFLAAKGYLGVDPTGNFGPLTLAAVKQFQLHEGLHNDGIVGPNTILAITKEVALTAQQFNPTK
ncbi:MAG TPA: peptidoglycan-binding domain-containing protein [Candidatus Paceibacterota bacterium]|nr:peptidoglycan-binding domain-containing protein [Candidatus Paceibacterota bacterium]